MSFIQLTINIDSENADLLSDIFLDLGALSASIEDPYEGTELEQSIYTEPEMPEPKLWEQSLLLVLFDKSTNIEQTVAEAKRIYSETKNTPDANFTYTITTLDDQDWVRLTQSQFNPIKIDSNLYIVPSWHALPDKNAIGITLDPGLAFGTGSHPTTFMCLRFISKHLNHNTKSLLDYGCGSGILAIAAKKCGVIDVSGVDIDTQAIESSISNAHNNQVEIQFGLPDEITKNFKSTDCKSEVRTFEVVIANILSNPLKFLAPNLAALTKSTLILSGILESQTHELSQIYSQWFDVSVADTMDGWVLLRGQKK